MHVVANSTLISANYRTLHDYGQKHSLFMASYLLLNNLPTLLIENDPLASSGNSLLSLSLVDGCNSTLWPIDVVTTPK